MLGPDYERPAMDLPKAYTEPEVGATAPVPSDWWKLYGDPTLNELIAAALERNADIRLAVARIEEADANLRAASAAFLPEIDLGGNANRTRSSTTMVLPPPSGVSVVRNDVRLALSTSFELDFWGRLRRSVEAVRAQMLATRYAGDVVALTFQGLTAQAYSRCVRSTHNSSSRAKPWPPARMRSSMCAPARKAASPRSWKLPRPRVRGRTSPPSSRISSGSAPLSSTSSPLSPAGWISR